MLLLAAGIIGATVMPHVVYLHSALTKGRVSCSDDAERRELLRFQRIDVVDRARRGRADQPGHAVRRRVAVQPQRRRAARRARIEAAHSDLGRLVGGGAALAFAVALLASGLSSSSVGTYAGQVVMQGFIGRRIPVFLRRAHHHGPGPGRAGRSACRPPPAWSSPRSCCRSGSRSRWCRWSC